MKQRIDVVGAVLVRNGNVLAARRGNGMTQAGLWEFPGGKIESGEQPRDALRRELQEELLCLAEIGEHVATTEHEYGFGIVSLTTFYCTLRSGEPKLTEHSEIRWVPAPELALLQWAPADIPAVQRVIERFSPHQGGTPH